MEQTVRIWPQVADDTDGGLVVYLVDRRIVDAILYRIALVVPIMESECLLIDIRQRLCLGLAGNYRSYFSYPSIQGTTCVLPGHGED